MSLSEPLSLVPVTLWAHAVTMVVSCAILIPFAIGYQRSGRTSEHRYAQTVAVLLAVAGVSFSLITGKPLSPSHLTGVTGVHDHGLYHTLGGIALVVALLIQPLLGCYAAMHRRVEDDKVSELGRVHRIFGYTLVFVFIPLQMTTGLLNLFQVCSVAGLDQCLGHTVVSGGFVGAAVLYFVLAKSTRSLAKNYVPVVVENSVAMVGSTTSILYSVYSEWPYASANSQRHLAASLVLLGAALSGNIYIWRLRMSFKTMPSAVTRGIFIGAALVIVGALFIANEQTLDYGAVLHQITGSALIAAAIFRLLLMFKSLAAALTVAAVFLAASQRGFQILYSTFYRAHFPLPAVVVVLALTALLCYALLTWYFTVFFSARKAKNREERIQDLLVDDP